MHKLTPSKVLSEFHRGHRKRAAHPSRRTGSELVVMIKRAHDRRLDLKLRVERLKLLLKKTKGARAEKIKTSISELSRQRDIAQRNYEHLLDPIRRKRN